MKRSNTIKTKKLSKKLLIIKQAVFNLRGTQLNGIKGAITCIGNTCYDEGCSNFPCQTACCSGRETCEVSCFIC